LTNKNQSVVTWRRIRRTKDLADVAQIESICFDKDAFSAEMLDAWLKSRTSRGRVGCYKGKMVAFVIFDVYLEKIDIGDIAVLPEMRNRGLAKQMVRSVQRAARALKIKMVQLQVRIDNTAAIRSYEGVGFNIVGIVDKYYGDSDAYLMVWRHTSLTKAA
jgi:ribosomal-protein-alanine N-acetyltransferase